MAGGIKALLKQARDALGAGNYLGAKGAAQAALSQKEDSYEANLFLGKAAFHLREPSLSDASYRAAAAVHPGPKGLPAWKGLAELHWVGDDAERAADAYDKLLSLSEGLEDDAKRREYRWRLADACRRCGRLSEAASHLEVLLRGGALVGAERLQALCMLANLQLQAEQELLERSVDEALRERAAGPADGPPPLPTAAVRVRFEAALAASPAGAALDETLADIMAAAPPTPTYVRYYEAHLRRVFARLLAAPPRSCEREEARQQALAACLAVALHEGGGTGGGCCTPLPFEAALWLWEEEEELKGGAVVAGGGQPLNTSRGLLGTSPLSTSPMNSRGSLSASPLNSPRSPAGVFRTVSLAGGLWLGAGDKVGRGQDVAAKQYHKMGKRFLQQFPGNPSAMAVWALALRRQMLADPRAHSAAAWRRAIARMLSRAMDGGASTASGWKALAWLYYQTHQHEAALDAAVKGLAFLAERAEAGHEYLGQCAVLLRLAVARSLLKLGRIDEAEAGFHQLAEHVTEGETAFGAITGSRPLNLHLQAQRGLAQVDVARGDRAGAKQAYEAMLGAALMGRGASEHWAHAEYGRLLHQDGQHAAAVQQLATAVEVSCAPGSLATNSELARHLLWLGQAEWDAGGVRREDKRYAHAHLLASARFESPHQAAAFAALGRYYEEVDREPGKARQCYQRAVALDPELEMAGGSLRLRATAAGGAARQGSQALAASVLEPPA